MSRLIDESEFDEGIRQRVRMGSNSGYLAEEYEVTKEFPTIEEHHFRIEDPYDILQLQELQKKSEPMAIEKSFNSSSDAFKERLQSLMGGLDANRPNLDNQHPYETHGFYKLAQKYDDEGVAGEVMEKHQMEDLRQQVSSMSIEERRVKFLPRKAFEKTREVRNLGRQMQRLSIREEQL